MRDDSNGARRQKRSVAVRSEAAEGLAIRQAFLRRMDEQQAQLGFATALRERAAPGREKARSRSKR